LPTPARPPISSASGFRCMAAACQAAAVSRDRIARAPDRLQAAVVVETDAWVAMASEYRCLAHLPGIESAYVVEPEPSDAGRP
jgi:hypothetical protein